MLKALFGRPEKNFEGQSRIEKAVDNFIALSANLDANKHLSLEFAKVQQWQSLRLKSQYQYLFDHPQTSVASHFMLDEVYSGEQIALISEEIKRTAQKAWKIAPADLIDAAANTVEAHLLTVQIDEMLAAEFLAKGGLNYHNGSELYTLAMRKPEIMQARKLQLHQFTAMASIIEGYLSKQSLYYGLKMTSGIARKAGVQRLHQFLLKSCNILRETQGFSNIVNGIYETEISLLNQVQSGVNPFKFMDIKENLVVQAC